MRFTAWSLVSGAACSTAQSCPGSGKQPVLEPTGSWFVPRSLGEASGGMPGLLVTRPPQSPVLPVDPRLWGGTRWRVREQVRGPGWEGHGVSGSNRNSQVSHESERPLGRDWRTHPPVTLTKLLKSPSGIILGSELPGISKVRPRGSGKMRGVSGLSCCPRPLSPPTPGHCCL